MKRVVYSDILDIDKICSVYHKIMYNTKHINKIFDYNMFYTSNIISMKNGITFLVISIYLEIINYICLFHLLIKGV